MPENVNENCGLVFSHTLGDTYSKLKELQHRGQEAAGIGGFSSNGIDVVKWLGNIDAFSQENLELLFSEKNYNFFMGHVRYATKGRKDRLLQDAHPHVIGGSITDYTTHSIVRGARKAIVHNGQVDRHFLRVPGEYLYSECDSEGLLWEYHLGGIENILKNIPGSYSAVIFDAEASKVIAFRDINELKPLCLGVKDGKYEIASETRALEKGGKFIRDINGGEVVSIEFPTGKIESLQVIQSHPHRCFFEITYLQHPDSYVNGKKVSEFRKELGIALEEEFHPDGIDVISFVPRSPEFAAMGYAESYSRRYGVNFDDIYKRIFYKMSNSRTFILSTQTKREMSIDSNLYVSDKIDLNNKTVLIIDDSIIRGTESKRAVALLKEKKPNKIIFASYTPPIAPERDGIRYGCEEGVDIPPNPPDDYNYAIRLHTNAKGVSDWIGSDELHYLSTNNMLRTLGLQFGSCYRCIGGPRVYKIE